MQRQAQLLTRGKWAALVRTLIAPLICTGCVMGRVYRDHPLDEAKIARLERGVTTKAQVLELFGPPQEIEARELTAIGIPFDALLSRRGDKPPEERIVTARWFRYTYSRANAMALVLLLFNYAEFDQKSDMLVIFFDGDGRVEDFAYRKGTAELPRFGFLSRRGRP